MVRCLHTADLAVIFRPALLSHPSHELSPQEHQLSQDVLEFLIEHQDWFMLEIPPPSATKNAQAPAGMESVDIAIGSGDELGAWQLGRSGSGKISRRRTTSERQGSGECDSLGSRFHALRDVIGLNIVLFAEAPGRMRGEADNLSPVLETPPSREGTAVTVTRSRTMPSSRGTRNRSGNISTDDETHPKVLKKQKRVSAQPTSRS
jgi:GTPase-activating protein SAC7